MDRFLNFDIKMERTTVGHRAAVIASPAGEATVDLGSALASFTTLAVGPQFGSTRDALPSSDASKGSAPKCAMDGGNRLYDVVFGGEIGLLLARSRDEADRGGVGLRIRLRLNEVPELSGLPWEYLHDDSRESYLALSRQTSIVRYLEIPESVAPLKTGLPLRILAVVSEPHDVPTLDVADEWESMNSALASLVRRGAVELERLDATLPALQKRLRSAERVHCLHFIGHGTFEDSGDSGGLVFETAEGSQDRLSATAIAILLRDSSIRLVVLNACHGARSKQHDLFSGVATQLVRNGGAAAVVAMRTLISDSGAITLAKAFYEALGEGLSVDAALAEARKAMYFRRMDPEWGVPVLFMRAPDGILFDLHDRKREMLDGPHERLALRDVLVAQFDMAELRELCFELDVDWESIAGASKEAKVIEMIRYFQRRGRLEALRTVVVRIRPSTELE